MLDAILPQVRAALARNNPLLLTAEPGAGKTTLVPPALLDEPWLAGRKILLLEPRRVAARAAASRMASLRGEEPGQTFGWRMAQDTKVCPQTRLEVITEGVLTRMLQSDPELADVGLVLFDEFHERSLQADLGLALCLDVRKALRPDLRIGLLSATLDRDLVAQRLPDVVAVHAPGRVFSVSTEYRPAPGGIDDAQWLVRHVQLAWESVRGSVLVFLPGTGEIRRLESALSSAARERSEVVQTLHGGLSPRDQAQVLQPLPEGRRKTVLATSVAETSVTIPGVELVIDSGWSRLGRFDHGRSLDRLVTERLSQASADQRRGRAGRTAAGHCWRLWSSTEVLSAATDPEVLRADLAPLVLECAVWGARSRDDLDWMTPPRDAAWASARGQLSQLGAVDDQGAVTQEGKELARLGVGPRLGRMLRQALASSDPTVEVPIALACAALLVERDRRTGDSVDVRDRLEHVDVLGETMAPLAQRIGVPTPRTLPTGWPDRVGSLLAWAYPDRIAFRTGTTGSTATFQLASGRILKVRGSLAAEETLVIPEADAGSAGTGTVWLAAPLSRLGAKTVLGGLVGSTFEVEWSGWRAQVFRIRRWGALVFEKTGVGVGQAPDQVRESLRSRLVDPRVALPWSRASEQLLCRLRVLQDVTHEGWAWLADLVDVSQPEVLTEGILNRLLHDQLPWALSQRLSNEVPETLLVPSGNRRKLDYHEDGTIHLEVRIQEVFGLATTPVVATRPVVLNLLSPGHKPLQITSDLASFWANTYPEVRKEMRGRYPRHYWPENPLEAEPTSRPKPRGQPQ